MRFTARALTAVLLVACGARAPVPEPAVEIASPEPREPEPPAPPVCSLDLEAVRDAGTVMNYAIAGQTEASLRVWPDPDGDPLSIRFHYERRDENGLEAGIEEYRCGDFGLSLVRAGPDGEAIRFEPPVLLLPTVVESGETAGTATLESAEGESITFDYVHTFQSTPPEDSAFEGDRTGVASTLTLGYPASTVVSTQTTWIYGPGLLAAVVRTQEFESGRTYAEQLRTVVPGRR